MIYMASCIQNKSCKTESQSSCIKIWSFWLFSSTRGIKTQLNLKKLKSLPLCFITINKKKKKKKLNHNILYYVLEVQLCTEKFWYFFSPRNDNEKFLSIQTKCSELILIFEKNLETKKIF